MQSARNTVLYFMILCYAAFLGLLSLLQLTGGARGRS